MKKSLAEQIFEKMPYVLVAGFCVYWIRGVMLGQYPFALDMTCLKLFILPATGAWYCFNILVNLQKGRFIFALPKFFKYRTRKRVRLLFIGLQIIIFILLSSTFVMNWFVLVPRIMQSNNSTLNLTFPVKDIYAHIGVTDIESARRFVGSIFWGYYLTIILIIAIYILYRKYLEFRAKEKLLNIYREHAIVSINLKNASEVERQGLNRVKCFEFIIKQAMLTATLGLFTRLIPKITRGVYCGFILTPDPEAPNKQFINIASYCTKDTWDSRIRELAKRHKPSMLNIQELIQCWNNCFVADHENNMRFKMKDFREQKETCLSATGMAHAIERPKIFNFVWNCLALCVSYREKIKDIDGEGGEITRGLIFRSYLILPIKHKACVLAVIFMGCTRPFAFNGSMLPILNSHSHAIGQFIATLDDYNLLENLESESIAISSFAKHYFHTEEHVKIRKVLRKINRMVRKGEKHAMQYEQQ